MLQYTWENKYILPFSSLLSCPLLLREFVLTILLLHQSDHALRVVGPDVELSSLESFDEESNMQGLERPFFNRLPLRGISSS